jgi:hypothetical protein
MTFIKARSEILTVEGENWKKQKRPPCKAAFLKSTHGGYPASEN